MGWGDIPYELRERAQWAVAGIDKAPQWFFGDRLRYVSVTEPSQWGPFDQVAQVAEANGMNIGYILSAQDPFACIDLDVKDASNEPNPDKWTKPADFERYQSIVSHMQSYSEVSRSGKGVHIWVEGNIGPGVRRDGVEVYSQERFIICTGNRITTYGIENRQDMLSSMVQQMRPIRDELSPPLIEFEPTELDIDIINRGFNASNGEKFQLLWSGEWRELNYASQSEADYALINMLAFYSESNSQVRRLFRESALGQRKKAQRDDYINRSLKTIRRELEAKKFIDISALQAALDSIQAANDARRELNQSEPPPEPSYEFDEPRVLPYAERMFNGTTIEMEESTLDWPPGFVGYLAKMIHAMAPRPVKEIAIATAIAHMAGLTGRSWNISGTGLNLYIAVVARSATGKNIIHSAMKKLAKACSQRFPMYRNFIDGSNYVSAEGFEKSFRSRPSSVHHIPEFGKLLSRMNNARDQIMENYARSILGVYDVSGKHESVGDIVRSKKEDSVSGVIGPVAFSLIGESTPEVFKRAVTSEAIEDGLMSRFMVVEYKGDRTQRNDNPTGTSDDVIDWLCRIAQQATQMINQDQVYDVPMEPQAKIIADSFDKYCDDRIIGQTLEARRFVWNRAHLMALKLSAILAVADNCYEPVVTAERMAYAVNAIKKSIEARLPTLSEIGDATDENRLLRVKRIIAEYLINGAPDDEQLLYAVGVISYRHILQRAHYLSIFKKSYRGGTQAVKDTIQALVDTGYLNKMPRSETMELYGRRGDVYRINMTKNELLEIMEQEELSAKTVVG